MRPAFDARDEEIRQQRAAKFAVHTTPRQGDYIEFSDGVTRRISHVWDDGVQSTNNGSFYLGGGYMSCSGSHFVCVPIETLTLTEERREAHCWFFHHDLRGPERGVETTIPVRVWKCSVPAPTY